MSLANLLELAGHDVKKVQLINDRGIHIMKSLVAYQKLGEGKTPEQVGKKGDHFVGKFYVMFEREFEKEWQEYTASNEVADEDKEKRRQEFFGESKIGSQAQEMLRKWESEDKKVRESNMQKIFDVCFCLFKNL